MIRYRQFIYLFENEHLENETEIVQFTEHHMQCW